MRSCITKFGAALALSGCFALGAAASAGEMSGVPNTATDWTAEFCLTDCTTTPTSEPVTRLDFIMATGGVTFTSISPAYTDIAETMQDASATSTYGSQVSTITFSPADTADIFFTLGFSPPSTSTPFSFYWEQWDGSHFITTDNSATSSDLVSWNGSAFSFTPIASPVPEPGTLALLAVGIAGLALARNRRRRMKPSC